MDKQPEDRRSGHVRSAVEDRPAGPERYPAAIASLAPPARIAACDAGVLSLSLNPHLAKRFADGEFNRGDGIAVLFLSRRK